SNQLEMTPEARTVESHFRNHFNELEKTYPFLKLLTGSIDLITAYNLPEKLAKHIGLPRGGKKNDLAYRAALKSIQASYRLLPDRLRILPIYRMAMDRSQGKEQSSIDLALH